MKIKDIFRLVVSISLCQSAGFLGSLFTTSSIPTWYKTLKKPFFTPPNWLFGPVWISLYVLMGISLFLVWRRNDHLKLKTALIFFFIQLIFNILWSMSFFGLRSPLLGLIDIILLWVAILLTIQMFLKISRIAGLLLFPYFLWVSFAVLLNLFLWMMN
jgi:tryptophan-rich sensory protein